MLSTWTQAINTFHARISSRDTSYSGLEDQTIESAHFAELVRLNRHMITTASTDGGDPGHWIEGVIRFIDFVRIRDEIERDLQYIASNLRTGEILAHNLSPLGDYDEEMGKELILVQTSRMRQDVQTRDIRGTTRIGGTGYTIVKADKRMLGFTDDNGDIIASDRYITEPSDELRDDLAGIPDVLVSIIIEDPMRGRTSLFRRLCRALGG